MDEKKDKTARPETNDGETSIEQLLRDRQRLDDQLKDKFSKEVTVMFTDIKGSTSFFETYGDIEGRLMVQKHNEMLFPIVEQYGGRVIKTIGDAIMAAFEGPEPAVRSAIGMQQKLLEYNQTKKDQRDHIHVRIGINTGEGLVEKEDIFGDVVNVAARVESLTDPDEIMISENVFGQVRKTDDVICRFASQTKVKGKEEALNVYRVIWGDEDAVAGQTRSAPAARRKSGPRRRLEIDISREGETLRLTVAEKSDKAQSTIRPYEELQVQMSTISEQCRTITDLLNQANTQGQVSKDILANLRSAGQSLFNSLLGESARAQLRSASVDDLIFHIEDSLVQIPWELLYDGEQFLCLKFNMGRIVKTRQTVANIKQRELFRPLKMLIISDPRGDLTSAAAEGNAICSQLDTNLSYVTANQRSGQITPAYLTEKIRNFDMVHYAGHAVYDSAEPEKSGLLLDGGKMTSADIMKLVGGRPMPALVFCNACQSGQTEEWAIGNDYNQKIFGIANAFLMSGVQHYVGTFWEILDEPGKRFAIEFYRALMDGATTGEAMQQARHALIKAYGEDTIVWASYMLYGDPGFSYCDFAEESEAAAADAEIQAPAAAGGIRSSADDSVMFGSAAAPATDYKPLIMGLSLVFLIAIAFFFFMNRGPEKTALEKDPYLQSYVLLQSQKIQAARNGFSGLDDDDPRKHEGLAAVMFELGNFAKARELCQKTLQTAPRNRYARVIQGNMFFSEDKLDEALQEYEACAATKGGIAWQQAEALNGIARIHSSRGDDQKALQYYGQAAGLHTGSSTIQTNYGLAMQRTGNNAAALASLKQASAANPSDRYAAAMLAATRKKQKAEADQARQARIDTLVNDLAVSFKKGTAPQQQGDLWTTGPLTVSFIDFRAKGAPSAREGEDDFFLLRMNALLQEQGGIQIVEREILDKLLAELKLSSTDLVNPDTAVRLGRIMAARIIATGSIMRFGADIQVSFRLTDTETTAMKGAIAESGKDLDQLAETISKTIGAKLKKSYPVRGKIAAVENDEIILNIGSVSGVQTGMQFTIFAEGQTRSGKLRLKPVGTITIASVAEDEAYAPVPDRITGLQAKMRVEQLTN